LFAAHGIDIQAVTCDNAFAYTKAVTFRQTLTDLGVKHVRIRARRPQTNGKVERFNRTLLEQWAYVRTYRSNHARSRAFDRFLHTYNHHRPHTSLGGRPPMTRVHNAPRRYISGVGIGATMMGARAPRPPSTLMTVPEI
jgi:transposase InsO family protein